LGRGTSRDLVDAQNDFTDAKNSRTAALVSHTIARLKLYRDMGVLWVKDNGQWEENASAKK
jgi:outer membrane protein TolC